MSGEGVGAGGGGCAAMASRSYRIRPRSGRHRAGDRARELGGRCRQPGVGRSAARAAAPSPLHGSRRRRVATQRARRRVGRRQPAVERGAAGGDRGAHAVGVVGRVDGERQALAQPAARRRAVGVQARGRRVGEAALSSAARSAPPPPPDCPRPRRRRRARARRVHLAAPQGIRSSTCAVVAGRRRRRRRARGPIRGRRDRRFERGGDRLGRQLVEGRRQPHLLEAQRDAAAARLASSPSSPPSSSAASKPSSARRQEAAPRVDAAGGELAVPPAALRGAARRGARSSRGPLALLDQGGERRGRHRAGAAALGGVCAGAAASIDCSCCRAASTACMPVAGSTAARASAAASVMIGSSWSQLGRRVDGRIKHGHGRWHPRRLSWCRHWTGK